MGLIHRPTLIQETFMEKLHKVVLHIICNYLHINPQGIHSHMQTRMHMQVHRRTHTHTQIRVHQVEQGVMLAVGKAVRQQWHTADSWNTPGPLPPH